MAILDTDSFDRANSTTLGNSAGGNTWVEWSGNHEIASNVVQNVGDGSWSHSRLPVPTLTSLDHWAQASGFIPNISTGTNVAVEVRKGADSTATMYVGEWTYIPSAGVTRLRIVKWVAGVQTVLQTTNIGARAQTHTLKLEVRGTVSPVTLALFYDGVQTLSHTDSSSPILAGTQTGIGSVGQSAGKATINNFSCGDFASTPPPPPPPPPDPGSRDPYMDPFRAQGTTGTTRSCYKRPIGNSAVFAATTSPVFIPGSSVNINVMNYSKNIWHASPSDPLVPLYNQDNNFALAWTIRIPTNAVPNMGTDGHMMVVDEDEVYVYESGVVRTYTGAQGPGWRGEHWWRNSIRETGILTAFGGSGAWGNCAMGGIIRAGEPENGFRHALAGTLSNSAYHGPGHVWPALSQDNNLGTSGNVYIGSLLAIPPSVDVNALGITDARALNFARCLQDYGVYCTGSGNVFSGITFNGNGAELAQLTFPSRSQANDFSHPFWHGMSLATAQLQVVTSNTQSVPDAEGAGGGTPRVPFSAEFGDNPVGRSLRLDWSINEGAATGTVGNSLRMDWEILAPPGATLSLYWDIQGTPSVAGTGERSVAILDAPNEVKILPATREVRIVPTSRETLFLASVREVRVLRGQSGILRSGGSFMGKESISLAAGTTENLDFQLFLNKEPAPLGAPSAMVLVRKKFDGTAITPDVDMVLVTAALGKIRWEMLSAQTVLADVGYKGYFTITGGTNPGRYPSHGFINFSLE